MLLVPPLGCFPRRQVFVITILVFYISFPRLMIWDHQEIRSAPVSILEVTSPLHPRHQLFQKEVCMHGQPFSECIYVHSSWILSWFLWHLFNLIVGWCNLLLLGEFLRPERQFLDVEHINTVSTAIRMLMEFSTVANFSPDIRRVSQWQVLLDFYVREYLTQNSSSQIRWIYSFEGIYIRFMACIAGLVAYNLESSCPSVCLQEEHSILDICQ